MQKKVIKRKKKPNYKKENYQRVNNKALTTGKIVALLAAISILLVTYMTLGIELTIIVAILLAIIYGVWSILERIKNKTKKRKIISIILIILLTLGIAILVIFCIFMLYIKKEADPLFKASNLNTAEVTRLYDKEGKQFAKLGSENREKVSYNQLPEVLVDAVVATEDSRFFQHNGFDAPRFLKAAIGQVLGHSDAGGGSTLSMQVVKNSFTDHLGQKKSGIDGIVRKFEDIYLAIFKLEKKYTKEEIIEFYVNNHFLGGNIYGVQEAANAYFGKDVSELNLAEASTIAGMFKSPNYYRPTVNPKNATARRQTVLNLMVRHGYITKEEADIAASIPMDSLTTDSSTVSTTGNKYQGYIDTVVDEIKREYGVNPYTTSLLVYTNLDTTKQDAVNNVLNGEGYNWINDKVQTGVAVLDSGTGKILAIGNGRNVDGRSNSTIDQYNLATEIQRQPGSTAKPLFDYGPGIEYNNWSTYQLFDDAPYSYSNGQSIKNWDGGYFGTITLRRALSASRNIPALKAFQQVDNNKIKEFVTNLGITPEICNSGYNYDKEQDLCINQKDKKDTEKPMKLHEAHSIGAFTGVSPLQMAAAYAAFSNGGYYNKPYTVEKIVYRQTKKEITHKTTKTKVMSDATAYMISSVLQDVKLTGGTPSNVACKTGTTNFDENTMNRYNMPNDAIRDSWVIGYSPKTVIGMWYGYNRFTKQSIADGYVLHNIPATVQKDRLFNALVAAGAMESNREPFKQPSSVVKVGVAAGSNPAKLAAPGQSAIYEYFKKGYEPTDYDTKSYKLAAPTNLKATENNGRVTLTWSAVDNSVISANNDYGEFGYNVYKDNVLLGWTNKTSYTFTPDNVEGTYKVVATYKSYSGITGNAASITLEKQPEETPITPTEPTDQTEPTEPTNTDNQTNTTTP